MALGDWISGLFQSEQARGLSGGSAPSIALDDDNPYYNYRLRRHRAEGDLIADPPLLWYTSPFVKQRSGLGTHVASEIGDGRANYTDALLILSPEDHAKAARSDGWFTDAERVLGQEFETLCRREGLRRRYEHRPIGFKIIADGDASMGGMRLGLTSGEFVTGLLPNLYTGPVRSSWPVVAVHLNVPGSWEGYREVGRLHNDQRLFTIGAHWLDNFTHPELREAALYRLQQYPDGSFVHIVNPDLQDRYQVTSEDQDGTHVLTLATRSGEPLAYMVLVAEDAPTGQAVSRAHEDRPTGPRHQPPIPSVAPPMLIDDIDDSGPTGHRTIIPEGPSERIFTLQERGVLLQKVHFSSFMLGYDVFFGRRGELGTVVEDPAATFRVRRKTVSIMPHTEGVKMDGVELERGETHTIRGDVRIEVEGQKLEYKDLRALKSTSGWPYVGEIRRPASSTYMLWGDAYHIGRSRDCRVVLPDETRNDNIRWKPKVADGATIRARTGDIPKSKFYTDSIMVASEHATVDLRDHGARVVCNARHCYVFVRRGGVHHALYPVTSLEEPKDMDLEPGDEVLIGNCLFHVGYTPAEAGTRPAPAPRVTVDAPREPDPSASLSDAPPPPPMLVLRPRLPPAHLGPASPAPERPAPMASLTDVPTPRSLGKGPPPPPPTELPPAPGSLPSAHSMDAQASEAPDLPSSQASAEPTLHLSDLRDEPPPPPSRLANPVPQRDSIDRPDSASETDLKHGDAEPVQAGTDAAIGTKTIEDDLFEDHSTPVLTDVDDDETIPGLVDPFAQDTPVAPPPVPQPDIGGWDEDWENSKARPQAVAPDTLDATAPTVPLPVDEASIATDIGAPWDQAPAPQSERPQVVCTDDRQAQFELGRPMHIVLAGWMLNGEAVCGNHSGADFIVPENRILAEQTFDPIDYFRLKVRGRRGSLTLLAPGEVLIDELDPAEETYTDPAAHTIDVIRRDELGEEDFAIRLNLVADRSLPDPRARLLSLDYEDPLAAALVTRGLPKGRDRTVDLGDIRMTLHYDGSSVQVSDYVTTYRRGEDFHPFFVQQGDRRFKTAPEDGTPFAVQAGDRLVIGTYVYVLLEE
jgi:hypothetical protein